MTREQKLFVWGVQKHLRNPVRTASLIGGIMGMPLDAVLVERVFQEVEAQESESAKRVSQNVVLAAMPKWLSSLT